MRLVCDSYQEGGELYFNSMNHDSSCLIFFFDFLNFEFLTLFLKIVLNKLFIKMKDTMKIQK